MLKFDVPSPVDARLAEATKQNAERSRDILSEVKRDRTLEKENTEVSLKIIDRIRQTIAAIPDFSTLDRANRQNSFVKTLQEMWPENDHRGATTGFRLDAFGSSMGDASLRLAPMTPNATRGTDLKGNVVIRLGISRLLDSSAEDLQSIQEILALYIVHEMEHLIADGDEDLSGGEDAEKYFAYLSHPGEMRAHAKMFAYLYGERFPGETFQTEKMMELISNFRSSSGRAYYHEMAESVDAARRSISGRMAELTDWYLVHFTENSP